MNKKLVLILGLIVITAMFIVGFSSSIAKAAISIFNPSTCYTAAATTTLSYMTPGTATTTVSCNMAPEGAESAVLAIEVNASSTSIFNFNVEESMNGVDYFPVTQNQNASTTNPFNLTARGYYTLTFASSTIGGVGVSTGSLGVAGLNNRNHYIVDIPVRMKYVRAYATLPIGTTNGAVWMQIIPRENIN